MAAFKKLNLNHSKISDAIASYPNVESVIAGTPGKPNWIIKCNGQEVTLSIWLIGDGTTTINPGVGKNQDLGLLITEHIIGHCKTSDAKTVTYSIRSFKDEDLDLVISYLHDAIAELEINISNVPTGKKYELKNTLLKDTFTLIQHTTGTLQLQGKPLSIYSELYAIISELLPDDEIININNDTFKVNISKVDIYNELEFLLPTAYEKLGDNLKKILMASILLRKLDVELDDYSSFTFGALRGLEAFMKLIILQKYRIVKQVGDIFEHNGSRFEANDSFKTHVGSLSTVGVMESCYNFYSANRHGIFHADNMPEMSRIIDSHEASRIVDAVCKLIEEGSNEI